MNQKTSLNTLPNDATADTNNWLREFSVARAAVVVAHPDDESLWAGGLLSWWQDNAKTRMDIICCSIPATEPERAWKFYDVCEYFGARGRVLPREEVRGGFLVGLGAIDLGHYDVIFTHNQMGEYRHMHHVQVNEYVLSQAIEQAVFVFAYGTRQEFSEQVFFEPERKVQAVRRYNHLSKLTGMAKHHELLARWGQRFDLFTERHIRIL